MNDIEIQAVVDGYMDEALATSASQNGIGKPVNLTGLTSGDTLIYDAVNDIFVKGSAIGTGDMNRALYDPDDDGIIEVAKALVGIDNADITDSIATKHTHANKATIDTIDQNLSTTGVPSFAGVNYEYWNDIIITASLLGSGASAPSYVTLAGNLRALAFNGANTTEQLYGQVEIPHDYKEGTVLKPHIHWSPTTTAAGNVKWQMEFLGANKGQIYGSVTTTVSAVGTAGGIVGEHLIASFPDITGTDMDISRVTYFRIFRVPTDAQDTYNDNAIVHSVGIHYQCDSPGSKGIFAKT